MFTYKPFKTYFMSQNTKDTITVTIGLIIALLGDYIYNAIFNF